MQVQVEKVQVGWSRRQRKNCGDSTFAVFLHLLYRVTDGLALLRLHEGALELRVVLHVHLEVEEEEWGWRRKWRSRGGGVD